MSGQDPIVLFIVSVVNNLDLILNNEDKPFSSANVVFIATDLVCTVSVSTVSSIGHQRQAAHWLIIS